MNKENKMKEYVQSTYDELHAPDGLRRKVMNMSEVNGKKMGMSVVKKLAVAAAIAAVLFAGSNGVAYAMTGSTWVETMIARMSINGVWQDVELDGEVLEDGTVQYSKTLDVQDGEMVEMVLVTDSANGDQSGNNMNVAVEQERTEVLEEDGSVYLIVGDRKLDITEDMEDGTATGNYEKNGAVYNYEVKEKPGTQGCFELHIIREEK